MRSAYASSFVSAPIASGVPSSSYRMTVGILDELGEEGHLSECRVSGDSSAGRQEWGIFELCDNANFDWLVWGQVGDARCSC